MLVADIRRIGVILAAGRGRRMGRTKPLVEWSTRDGRKPLLAAAYDAIRPICDQLVVVLGHEAEAVAASLGERPFRPVYSDPDAPMFESIRAGLRAARAIDPNAVVVLQPGDHPEVARSTLATLSDCSLKRPAQAIIPQYADRGGHPALVPPNIVALLLHADCPQGLGQFWIDHPEHCHRIAVDDPSVLRDVDTADQLPG